MNKAQSKIAWIMSVIISGISIYYGIENHTRIRRSLEYGTRIKIDTGLFLLFVVIIPILLIGGLLFIQAKKKIEK